MGFEERLGFRHQAALLEKAESDVRLPPKHKVGCDRERFDQAEVLVDDRDPRLPRFCGASEGDRPAFNLDRASVEAVDAAEDLDQRRLTGAVLPEQRMNFARPHLKANAAQRSHAAKRLRHALNTDKRGRRSGGAGDRRNHHGRSNVSPRGCLAVGVADISL